MPTKSKVCLCGLSIWSKSLRCRKCAKAGNLNPMFNKKQTDFQKRTVSRIQKGKRNKQWKGSLVGYAALHEWVRKNFGQPDVCEDCNMSGIKGNNIHWANVSGKYIRLRYDWKRLCVKCHRRFAKSKITTTVAVNGNSRVREIKKIYERFR